MLDREIEQFLVQQAALDDQRIDLFARESGDCLVDPRPRIGQDLLNPDTRRPGALDDLPQKQR